MEKMDNNMLSLKDISRSNCVTRWHSVPTRQTQSIAEHQYMVAVLAQAIAKAIAGSSLQPSDELILLNYALFHDTPEIAIGDIPTPMKQKLATRHSNYHAILTDIETEVCHQYDQYHRQIKGTYLAAIVKLADIMDAISFLQEHGYTRYTDKIQHKLTVNFHHQIKQYQADYSQYDWSRATDILEELLNGEEHLLETGS